MKQTELIMGMPITVEIVGDEDQTVFAEVFDYFRSVDERYSTYKPTSEISQINRGLPRAKWSAEMKRVLQLCEETKRATNGYFDIERDGKLDPSGLVKGWAIDTAAQMLRSKGLQDFYIEAGGDIQTSGRNSDALPWAVGIRHPANTDQIVKIVHLSGESIATSGTYIRGEHIYNPLDNFSSADEITSLSVIAPNIYDADRFATAAFAMGKQGIHFINSLDGFEAYMIDHHSRATFTPGFERYTA